MNEKIHIEMQNGPNKMKILWQKEYKRKKKQVATVGVEPMSPWRQTA